MFKMHQYQVLEKNPIFARNWRSLGAVVFDSAGKRYQSKRPGPRDAPEFAPRRRRTDSNVVESRRSLPDLCPTGRQEMAMPLCTRENETSTGRLTLSHIGECEVANFKNSAISFSFPPALIRTLALMF